MYSRTYLQTFVWILSALQTARTAQTCGPLEAGPYRNNKTGYYCVDMRWCLYKLYKDPRNWTDARQICSQDSHDLLRVTDVDEHNFLTSYFQSSFSIAIPRPFDSTLWLGMQQNDGDVPRWHDDCSTQPAGYNPVTSVPGAHCFLLDTNAATYTHDACSSSKMFVCKAKSYDMDTCYTSIATCIDVTLEVGVYYVGHTAADYCARYCTAADCVGYRYHYNTCTMLRAASGRTHTKGEYMKAMQQTAPVVITEPVSYVSDSCQAMYSTRTHELPVIKTTLAPDPVSTLDTNKWPMSSTAHAYPSVSVTGTVSIVPSTVLGAALQNLSDNIGQMKTANMSQLTLFCKQLLGHVLDHPDHMCSDVEKMRQIENQITTKMEKLPTGDLDMNTTVDSYLQILNLAYDFDVNMECRRHDNMSDLLELQHALIRHAQLYLRLHNISKTFEHNGTSVSLTVGYGSALQGDYSTAYGRVMVQNLETSRRILANQKLMILIISYKENPFRYSQPPGHINLPVMTTVAIEEDGEVPDLHFIMGFPTSSELDTNGNTIDMVSNGTHYMAAFPGGFFNSSTAMMFVDISMMGPCRIYGKYGTTSPTDHDFDTCLHTNEFLSVTKYRPYNFSFSFIEGILQFPIYQTPVIITTQCQAGKFTKQGDVPNIRINQVLPQVIDETTHDWKSDKNVQLVGGKTSEITLKSYFFGTFTASVKLISPDMIDFQTVFLNFSEKLIDTPYVLGTVIAVLILLAISTPILRRRDVVDSALWSYQHLVDNKASSAFHYYICVSTGVRSKRQMESSVYINIIGTRDETGTRLLTGNNRKNFSNGTSAHFCLKSDVYLGNIKTVHIWLGGNVKLQSWYLTRVVIIDGKTSNAIQLKCNKWLSIEKGTGRTWCTLRVGRNTDSASSLSEVSTRNIFDDHLWFSLIIRPGYSRFTRVQRLWSIVSLLFIAMVASAMFYDTPDNTSPLINIAGFELGFKEIYTGFMSSVITVAPCMIMAYIFSNRKKRGEKTGIILNDGNTVRSSGSLPWWSIFLAYSILLICISSGSFFTLLYSLEWGPSLTIKWMCSFFLGTTESVLLIEPTKAFILAVIMVFIFSSKTHRKDFNIPPTSLQLKHQESFYTDRPPLEIVDCPCDKHETYAQRRRRYMLRMDRKLNRFMRKLILGMMYVGMLLVICTQQKVSDVFGQNMHLKNILEPTQKKQRARKSPVQLLTIFSEINAEKTTEIANKINTMDEVWEYMHTVVLHRLSPVEFYNGEVKPYSELRYVGTNYRMGPIRIRQTRVSGICNAPPIMKTHGITCIPDFDKHSADTEDYIEGWISSNTTAELDDHNLPYIYHYDIDKETPSYSGHFGTYDGGGYLVDLDFEPAKAIDVMKRLQSNAWLDGRTRAFFIEACVVNRNNMFFSQIKVAFEFPSLGGTYTETRVDSSNLYPYRGTFDFFVLGVQVVFVIAILVRFVLFVVKAVRTRGHSLLTFGQAVDMFDLLVSIAAVVCLVMRFTSTIDILNTLRHDIGFYSSFGYVFEWDGYFSVCLGMATCIAILDLLQHLSFNYHFYLMYRTITTSRMELIQFTMLLMMLMVGFSGFIHLMYGHMEGSFRNISSGILTLFRMTIGMIKFRNDLELEGFGIFVVISIYALAITMGYINIFTSSLNYKITYIKELIVKGKTSFDWHLNQHFWNRLASILSPSRSTKMNTETKQAEPRKKIDLRESEDRVDVFLSNLIERSAYDLRLEMDFFKNTLLPSRHFTGPNFIWSVRRETIHGVKYRYSKNWIHGDNVFVLDFPDEKVTCRIDVECIQILEANRRGLIPYGHSTKSVSSLYIVNIQNSENESCKVMVKVASAKLFSRHAFLITGCGNPTRWQQHTAQYSEADDTNVYLSILLPECPRYVVAVTLDTWCDIQPVIQQEHLKEFVLTRKEMAIHPGSTNNLCISFLDHSVSSATIIKTVVVPGDRFPTLHVLASGDVLGPIIIEYIRKDRTDQLSSESFMELQLLTKTGDLEWKQEVAWTQQHVRGNIVELSSLSAGVKTAIAVCLSDYRISFARITNRYLERDKETLVNIYKKLLPTKHWRQIGRSIGVPQHKLVRIENGKPRSLEEKSCLVLGHWLKENPGRRLHEIKHIWK